MEPGIFAMFEKMPAALPLYRAAEEMILADFPDAVKKVSKTQVSFSNRYGFAWLSPPVRRAKDWPETCILVTFGLGYRLEHPRIAVAVEPYPNRWTHHVVVSQPDQLDDQLRSWLRESWAFSMGKGRQP